MNTKPENIYIMFDGFGYNIMQEDIMKKIFFIMYGILSIVFIGCTSRIQGNTGIVSVSGIGVILVQPDMAQIALSVSQTRETTKEAKEMVDKKMFQVMKYLKEEGIDENNIRTTSLVYDEDTEYVDGRSIKLGKRVQQTIMVTIHDIVNAPDRFLNFLDYISDIDGLVVRRVIFDTEDKTEYFRQSRDLAYQKVLDKANQYAFLCGLKIIKVSQVFEEESEDAFRNTSLTSNIFYDTVDSLSYRSSSSVPTGEQEVRSKINVTFLME